MKQSKISASPIKEANPESVRLNGQKGAHSGRVAIKKADFDRAVKQPFEHSTCLLAQFSIRNNIRYSNGAPKVFGLELGNPAALQARLIFDAHFKLPGDEKKPELQALRASLPITITLP